MEFDFHDGELVALGISGRSKGWSERDEEDKNACGEAIPIAAFCDLVFLLAAF